jgi:hypothetical protein
MSQKIVVLEHYDAPTDVWAPDLDFTYPDMEAARQDLSDETLNSPTSRLSVYGRLEVKRVLIKQEPEPYSSTKTVFRAYHAESGVPMYMGEIRLNDLKQRVREEMPHLHVEFMVR